MQEPKAQEQKKLKDRAARTALHPTTIPTTRPERDGQTEREAAINERTLSLERTYP